MTIEFLSALHALPASMPVAPDDRPQGFLPPTAVTQAAPAGSAFAEAIARGLGELNTQLMTTQVDLQELAMGNVQNLHQVMIRLEESRTAFQLAMQVRQRLLDAYQDVMKMQL